MDLQDSLVSCTRFLLRKSYLSYGVWIDPLTSSAFKVVVRARTENTEFAGAAIAGSITDAYTKALSELGEDIIAQEHKISCASGLAGGLFSQATIIRAKNEALERDAFLWHYRKQIPFRLLEAREKDSELCVFEMKSADPRVNCVLIANSSVMNGTGNCLVFGLGAHGRIDEAIEKGRREYFSLLEAHRSNPAWCCDIAQLPNDRRQTADFHHAASRDPRNIARLKLLCSSNDVLPQRDKLNDKDWTIRPFSSPILGFRYYLASHPGLSRLEFLVPEADEQNPPLFHPFW